MARVKFTPGPGIDRLKEIAATKVAIGMLGDNASKSHGDDATNVDVATWMEFGTDHGVPERSFLRATIREDKAAITKFAQSRFRMVIAGKLSTEDAYEQIGLKVRALVQARIRAGIPPALKRREGVPLIDTGQLIGSITPEVRPK